MSGGVDSSTVAAILRDRGEPIIGLTMQLWNQRRLPQLQSDGPAPHRCCSLDDVYDARRVAEHLAIPYYVINFEREFEETVVRPFVDDYLSGRTPIPCTHCNNHVKFDQLLVTARQIGADRIATGHYARVRHNRETGRYELLRAVDRKQGSVVFPLRSHARTARAHGISPWRADQAGSARNRAPPRRAGCGKAREPGNLFRPDGQLRPLHRKLFARAGNCRARRRPQRHSVGRIRRAWRNRLHFRRSDRPPQRSASLHRRPAPRPRPRHGTSSLRGRARPRE